MEIGVNCLGITRQLIHIFQFIVDLNFGHTLQVTRPFITDFQRLLVKLLKKRVLMEVN